MTSDVAMWAIVGLLCFGTAVAVSIYIYYGRLYIRSQIAGTPIAIPRMMRLSYKGANAHKVVSAYLDARLAGLDVSFDELEEHALGGGNVRRVVNAVIAAQSTSRRMTLAQARTWDLQGKDPLRMWEQSA